MVLEEHYCLVKARLRQTQGAEWLNIWSTAAVKRSLTCGWASWSNFLCGTFLLWKGEFLCGRPFPLLSIAWFLMVKWIGNNSFSTLPYSPQSIHLPRLSYAWPMGDSAKVISRWGRERNIQGSNIRLKKWLCVMSLTSDLARKQNSLRIIGEFIIEAWGIDQNQTTIIIERMVLDNILIDHRYRRDEVIHYSQVPWFCLVRNMCSMWPNLALYDRC